MTNHVKIQDAFWEPRLQINSHQALLHQWRQLEKTGCIENFRLAAGEAEGIRMGYFYADSDAYKWLEAAARSYAGYPSAEIKGLMDAFIVLIQHAQMGDGYIYTYNQLNFPGQRWVNLQIEHELYCMGHLIEAGVSHYESTGEDTLLNTVTKTADLLVKVFSDRGPEDTPGHEEVEIALIRLYNITSDERYLNLAESFLERRGRIKPFLPYIYAQKRRFDQRANLVKEQYAAYLAQHPEHAEKFQLPPENVSINPPSIKARYDLETATGKYFQQHKPIREQIVPEGHAVRFAYLETAIAMLYREHGDESLLEASRRAWEHMVTRRMYVSGGIGSLPLTEGFGRDYELDPKYAYAETCAALGSIFWNWQMALISGEARYSDLIEWQLYNAALVGIGQDGTSYLYNNPLSSASGLTRQPWFRCACCPSNVSRTWANLGRYIASTDENTLWLHQYIGSQINELPLLEGTRVNINSELPWNGKVTLSIDPHTPGTFILMLRIPSWSDGAKIWFKERQQETAELQIKVKNTLEKPPIPNTASGYDPRESQFMPLEREWLPGDTLILEFEMPIVVRRTHPKVQATRGKGAVTRGPILYCLESIDNPDIDIFSTKVDEKSIRVDFSPELFGGINILRGQTTDGRPLIFIPYYLWANRGVSQMTVYFNLP